MAERLLETRHTGDSLLINMLACGCTGVTFRYRQTVCDDRIWQHLTGVGVSGGGDVL